MSPFVDHVHEWTDNVGVQTCACGDIREHYVGSLDLSGEGNE